MHRDSCGGMPDGGLKLFGVRIVGERSLGVGVDEEEVMRKSASMGNLASCAAAPAATDAAGDHGYLSDGGLIQSSRRRGDRKRGVPWTEEEHRTFLAGLKKLGKGDWRGISRNYVISRTPTQVASHAQKYFLRQNNPNRKKRRSSLFDVVINNDAAVSSGISSTVSLKKAVDVTEGTNHLCEDKHVVEISSSSVTRRAFGKPEGLPAIPAVSKNSMDTPSFHIANVKMASSTSSEDHGISGLSITQTLHIREQAMESWSQPKSTVGAPDLPSLSFPRPNCPNPPSSSSTSASIDNSDLELSIAPPGSHNLSNLSSQGAISVI